MITSWDSVQKDVLESAGTGSSKLIPYEIALVKPTLGHLHQFTQIFESQLASGLQADFFWGIIGVLLKVSLWLTAFPVHGQFSHNAIAHCPRSTCALQDPTNAEVSWLQSRGFQRILHCVSKEFRPNKRSMLRYSDSASRILHKCGQVYAW